MTTPTPPATRIYVEIGRRRTFAAALEWPGWARSGRGEEEALDALRAYAARYAPVVRLAGLEPPDPARIQVVERLTGSASTEFGVLAAIPEQDHEPLTEDETGRLVRLMESGWAAFDRIAAGAPPVLRKGPRGGGRDRDAIVDHVVGAEAGAYAPRLAVRLPRAGLPEAAAVAAQRSALVSALRRAAAGPEVPRSWPPRYAARRIAWHVLDHAWEIEDRALP